MLVLSEGFEPSSTRLSTVRVCRLRHDSSWYRRRDSNPHGLVSKTSASFQLGYAGVVNPAGLEPATCRLGNDCSGSAELRVREFGYGGRIRTYVNEFQRLAPFQLGHSVRFDCWWTWHDLNVRPRPSQSRALIPLSYRSVEIGGRDRT